MLASVSIYLFIYLFIFKIISYLWWKIVLLTFKVMVTKFWRQHLFLINYTMYTGSRFVVKVILYRECMYDANWTCWSFQRNQQKTSYVPVFKLNKIFLLLTANPKKAERL